jgi:hypothetical protein
VLALKKKVLRRKGTECLTTLSQCIKQRQKKWRVVRRVEETRERG